MQTQPCEHARLHVHVPPGGRKSRLCEEGRTASSPKPLDEKKTESFVKTHLRDFFFIIVIICLPFDERLIRHLTQEKWSRTGAVIQAVNLETGSVQILSPSPAMILQGFP